MAEALIHIADLAYTHPWATFFFICAFALVAESLRGRHR